MIKTRRFIRSTTINFPFIKPYDEFSNHNGIHTELTRINHNSLQQLYIETSYTDAYV